MEWWTYSLADFLPFARETWLRLFVLYNADIYPLQFLFAILGLTIVWQLLTASRQQLAIFALALVWCWVAWQFHWERYVTLNWAAMYFAFAFFLQAGLLLWWCVLTRWVRFSSSYLGIAVVIFAVLIQPFLGLLFGRQWQELESFGATPDPTTTAMLGLLLLARGGLRWLLLVIPLSWCMISGATALAMESWEAVIPFGVGLFVVMTMLMDSIRWIILKSEHNVKKS